MATKVLKLKMVTESATVELRCHIDGNVLTDVTMDRKEFNQPIPVSVLQTLSMAQREEIVKRCSKHVGFDIVIPHVRPGQLGKLIEIAKKNNGAHDPGFTKPEDCMHKFVAVVISELVEYEGLEHIEPKQLRCMTCGASFVRCESNPTVFHRLGETHGSSI